MRHHPRHGDLKSHRWIIAKGILFLVLALLAAVVLLVHAPHAEVGLLLAVCVWASCRGYYFVFYVLQHYVDPDYRYRGLIDLVRHTLAHRTRDRGRPKRSGDPDAE